MTKVLPVILLEEKKNRVMAQFFKAKPGLKNLQLEGCSI